MVFVNTLCLIGFGLNVLLAVYHLRLITLGIRYHRMAAKLLSGAWQMRDWPTLYTVEPGGDHTHVSVCRQKPTGR